MSTASRSIRVATNGARGETFAGALAEPFARAWQHRELIRAIVRRDLVQRFRNSYVGWFWAVLSPLVMLTIYVLTFSKVLSAAMPDALGGGDRTLAIFVGLIIFNLFAELISRAPMLLHEHAHFIKKSIFPSDSLAWIALFRALTYAGIGVAVLLVFELGLTGRIPLTVLLLPALLVPFCMFTLGLIWFLAALGALTRDVAHLMITVVPVIMFATPIFYAVSDVPPEAQFLIFLNPLTAHVEMARDVLLYGEVFHLGTYLISFAVSAAVFYIGYVFFMRFRNVVIDIL